MKKITKITEYWFLKPVNNTKSNDPLNLIPKTIYYYIRIKTKDLVVN